jgi:AraC-like DNA-binding protein
LRQLHLLFEPTGTSFAQYVTQHRLQQCRAALASPTGLTRSVADIAFGWGFNSLATFYRAFEREFGLPPNALRSAPMPSN